MRRVWGWLRGIERADWVLAMVVLAGLVVRVAYVLANRDVRIEGDGEGYYFSARLLADGHGFVAAPIYLLTPDHLEVPSADHPPAWTLLLATLALAGFTRVVYFQLLAGVVGALTVAAVGVTGRRLGGRRCGLVAAVVAALYPNLWMYERVLQCETLALLLVTGCVYFAYGFWERPGRRDAVLLGLSCGLLAMTRPEALLAAAFVVAPVIVLRGRQRGPGGTTEDAGGTQDAAGKGGVEEGERPGARAGAPLPARLRWLALAGVMVLVPIVPWAAYNLTRFEEPVILTTNLGQTLAAANCDEVYGGARIGWWSYECLAQATGAAERSVEDRDASLHDLEMRRIAREYIRDHESRLPAVVLAREGRTWGVYRPFEQLELDAVGGPSVGVARLGLLAYWPLSLLALAGLVVLRRRAVPVLPLVGFAVTVAVASGLTIGQTRYRALAEVPVVLLAAVAVDAVTRRRRPEAPASRGREEILRTQLPLNGGQPDEAADADPGDTRCLQSPLTTS